MKIIYLSDNLLKEKQNYNSLCSLGAIYEAFLKNFRDLSFILKI